MNTPGNGNHKQRLTPWCKDDQGRWVRWWHGDDPATSQLLAAMVWLDGSKGVVRWGTWSVDASREGGNGAGVEMTLDIEQQRTVFPQCRAEADAWLREEVAREAGEAGPDSEDVAGDTSTTERVEPDPFGLLSAVTGLVAETWKLSTASNEDDVAALCRRASGAARRTLTRLAAAQRECRPSPEKHEEARAELARIREECTCGAALSGDDEEG